MQNDNYTTHSSRSDAGRRRRKQRARRRLLVLVVVLVVVLAAAAVLAAVFVARGRGGQTGAGGSGAAAAAPTGPSLSPPPPPDVWVAGKADPVSVWVGGDSMGGELGFALEPVLEQTKGFKTITYYKESTGICRYDFFDWGRQIETVMKTVRPDAAVIMIGTNDTQSVWREGNWIAYGNSAWKRAYEDRVGEIMDTMLEGGVRRLYWVGMPIMGEGWRNSRMRLINRVFQKQAEKRPGAEFIDIWGLYAHADGSFDPSLRLGDQVHFTIEGQELLADTVYEAIRRDWLPAGSGAPRSSSSATPAASASSI